jgi:hypothetical protein
LDAGVAPGYKVPMARAKGGSRRKSTQLPEDFTTVLLEKIDEHHRPVLEALFAAERRLSARIEAFGTRR